MCIVHIVFLEMIGKSQTEKVEMFWVVPENQDFNFTPLSFVARVSEAEIKAAD